MQQDKQGIAAGIELDRSGRPQVAGVARRHGKLDAGGYSLFVLLHAAWLLSLALLVPASAAPSWPLLAVFAALQLGRLWVIASLGRYWTTRIIVPPDRPPVSRGPYRFFRHPNYLIVVAEIAILPLAFGAMTIAAVFSAANLALLARRIAIEERALAPRRRQA